MLIKISGTAREVFYLFDIFCEKTGNISLGELQKLKELREK